MPHLKTSFRIVLLFSVLTLCLFTFPHTSDAGTITGRVGEAVDTDGDGIPDYWETQFGLGPNDPTDALSDTDGDGITNLDEYLTNSDPGIFRGTPLPTLTPFALIVLSLILGLVLFRSRRTLAVVVWVSGIGLFIGTQVVAEGVVTFSYRGMMVRAVSGALVMVEDTGQSAVTDSAGNFTLTNVPTGTHALVVEKSSSEKVRQGGFSVSATRATDAGVLLIKKTGELKLTVVLSDGSDPSGAEAYLVGTRFSDQADADGKVEIEDIPEGTYTVRIEKSGYRPEEEADVEIKSSGATNLGNVTLNLISASELGMVAGKVLLKNQSDHSGITVSVGMSYAGVTATDGTFRVTGVPAGVYYLSASKSGWVTRISSGTVTVTAGKTITAPSMTLDPSLGPQAVSILINNGAAFTQTGSVTLQILAHGATQMIVSENVNFIDANWEFYSEFRDWTFSGEGTKSIFVKFRDQAGLESGLKTDSIVFDATAPTGGVSFQEGDYTNHLNNTLNLSGGDTRSSGIALMRIGATSDLSGVLWEGFSATKSWTISSGEGSKAVYAQFRDRAGNNSLVISKTITLDQTPPSGGTVSNTSGIETLNFTVTVNHGTDSLSGMSGNNSDYFLEKSAATFDVINNSCGTFSGFSDANVNETTTASVYSFSGTNRTCVKFRYTVKDRAGNVSMYNGTNISKVRDWGTLGLADSIPQPEVGHDVISFDFDPSSNEPYVAAGNYPGTKRFVRVMKLSNGSWINVGSDIYLNSAFMSLAVNPLTSEPYIAVCAGKATVLYFDANNNDDANNGADTSGAKWKIVGFQGFSTGGAEQISIKFNPSTKEPYVVFEDYSTTNNKLSAMYFDANNNDDANNGADTSGAKWKIVGSQGFSAGGVNGLYFVFNPSNSEPYVAYTDTANSSKATVMKYSGGSWGTVGSAGITNNQAHWLSIAFHPTTNEPYIAFAEGTSPFVPTVMKFSGGTWQMVGSAGLGVASAGYTQIAFNPSTSEPYVLFETLPQQNLRGVKFTDASWVSVGSPDFIRPLYLEYFPFLFLFKPLTYEPHVAFFLLSGRPEVMKY